MSAPLVEFEVIGEPKPQGSMKAFNGAGGRAMAKPSGGAAFAQWRNAVSTAARDVADDLNSGDHLPPAAPFDGPLGLHIEFRFPMPASRPKVQRAAGRWPKTTAPDTDKLIRAVGDALVAAGLVVDDARFAVVVATKVEVHGSWAGAIIRITDETVQAAA